jgi:hypothetical protein
MCGLGSFVPPQGLIYVYVASPAAMLSSRTLTNLVAHRVLQGRLNELMSQLRMLNQLGQGHPSVSYHMTPAAQLEIKEVGHTPGN